MNHNGVRDPGAVGLADRTIFIDANHNGSLDPGGISTATDASACTSSRYVPAGAFAIRELLPAGWARTAPLAAGMNVSVVAAQAAAGPTFGDVQISTVAMNFSYLLTLAQHYGQQGTFASGDLNGDEEMNFNDLLLLLNNYGHTLPSAPATRAVPTQHPAPPASDATLVRCAAGAPDSRINAPAVGVSPEWVNHGGHRGHGEHREIP